jgi:LacI family transcriptional regulator
MPPSKNPASKNPATITDVARLAGVSPGTVSKALNGRGALSLGTIQRIQQAAEQLGYQPNALARGLLAGRTFTVGLITTDSFGRFSIPVMQGAEDALGPGRIAVLLCDSRDDQIREQHYLRTLLERRVDGIIVTGRRQDPREPIGSDIPVPVVYAMTSSTNPGDLSLVPDDAEGGAIAVRHLLSTGRTRIGHVTGPMSFAASRLRAQGAEQTLAAAGLELAAGGAMYGEWTEEWGRQATDGLLRAAPDLDAIFCGNDQIARGVADAVREAGKRVPEDIALVGFDNWEVIAAANRPPLTTVDMNLRELGRTAGEELLSAIEGRPSSGLRRLPCSLVLRESSRPRQIQGQPVSALTGTGAAALLVQGGGVGGDVDRIGLEDLQRNDLERALVGRGQHHRRAGAVLVRLQPVGRGHAPPVPRHQPGEPELGHRGGQIVADPALVLEEFGRHHRADGVAAQVLGAGRAASVPVETGERIGSTRLEFAAQHITVAHACSIRTAHSCSQDRPRASGC